MFTRYRTSPAGTVRFLCGAAVALWIAAGCGSLPDHESGSIFQVMNINAYYQDAGSFTNQVDVVQVDCETDPAEPPDWEFFSDHFVSVAFLNRHLPYRTGGSDVDEYTASVIYLDRYEIRYTPLTTVTAAYPLPSPLVIPVTQTVAIPPCPPGAPGVVCAPTTMTHGYFVPVATKDVLRGFFLAAGEQLAYSAQYTFIGMNDFGKQVTATAQLNFYVANYNYCDGSAPE